MSRYNSSDIAGTMEVALGKKPASMLIKNGKLINVYSGKIEDNISIAIYKNRFAYIGDLSNILIDEDTSIIDANGAYIMPGFIDAHTHLDSIFQLGEYAKYAILSGNTTAITETAMIANSFGYK
ncbi:MAG: adenine deaminase, partial [Spirochaetes bacterium]